MTVSRLKFVGLLFENLSGYTVVGEKNCAHRTTIQDREVRDRGLFPNSIFLSTVYRSSKKPTNAKRDTHKSSDNVLIILGVAENCVIANEEGFWNDVQCSAYYHAFCRKPADHKFCEVEYSLRDDCGYSGIQEFQCVDYGCCWNPSPDGTAGHWCFHIRAQHIYTVFQKSQLFANQIPCGSSGLV